jgi:two-component system chemotaxis sensor kinase CheA
MALVIGTFSVLGYQSLGSIGKSLNANAGTASKYAALLNHTREAQIAFQVQVQEWKNVMIRGNQADLYKKHWAGFEKEEAKFQSVLETKVRPVMKELALSTDGIDKLQIEHKKLGEKYREAVNVYDQAASDDELGKNIKTVDKMLRGIDRATSAALSDLSNQIQKSADKQLGETVTKSAAEAKESIDTFNTIAAISLLAAVGACIGAGVMLIRKIIKLQTTMVEISETNNLELRAELSNDEVGVMAKEFNGMVQKVAESAKIIQKKANDVQTMLKNMPQGLFTIDADNKIHPEYSAYLHDILNTKTIAGRDMMQLLFTDTNLGSDSVAQVGAIAGAIVGEDAMNFEFNQHLLPREIEKRMIGGSEKVLDLTWAPVIDQSGTVEQLLVCVRDVTELRELNREAAKQKRELEIIGEILGVPQEKFNEMMISTKRYLELTEKAIRDNKQGSQEVFAEMFKFMHTIKGNGRTFNLTHLTNWAHEVEETYSALRNGEEGVEWNQTALLDELAGLKALVEHYNKTNEETLGRKEPGRRGGVEKFLMVDKKHIVDALAILEKANHNNLVELQNARSTVQTTLRMLGTESLDKALSGMIDWLPTAATQLGKSNPTVKINDHGFVLKNQTATIVKDIFMHLFRNAIDHGIESKEERLAAKKPEQGTISIDMQLVDGKAKITIQDDGRGIALAKIRKIGLAKGLVAEGQKLNDQHAAELIFKSGFSTADTVTVVSGRGVGMDAVKSFASAELGNVEVRFLDNKEGADHRAFEIVVTLPGTGLVNTQA